MPLKKGSSFKRRLKEKTMFQARDEAKLTVSAYTLMKTLRYTR